MQKVALVDKGIKALQEVMVLVGTVVRVLITKIPVATVVEVVQVLKAAQVIKVLKVVRAGLVVLEEHLFKQMP